MRLQRNLPFILLCLIAPFGCEDEQAANTSASTCEAEAEVRTTPDGVAFVRTPDACFASLPGWDFVPKYVEIDGLRQAYVEEGPADGPVVLLLHGQPSWSYLYRKMIPVLADAGYRTIAMDHLGMGRSDKPVDLESYSYLLHNERLEAFIEALELRDINLFVQDWGSVVGLRVAGLHPAWFARIAVGDGALPVFPAGVQLFPPVEDPDAIADLPAPYAGIPPQQQPFYDGCDLLQPTNQDFGEWIEYAMTGESFRPSETLEAMTWFDLPADEEAAYDAPFPSRIYMAGPRVFPSLINDVPGATQAAWEGLSAFEKPFTTIWAANDPGQLGSCETQNDLLLSVPGSTGMPHVRLPEASHFLQDDQGVDIATRLVEAFAAEPVRFDIGPRYCEVLLARANGGEFEVEVWGTQNISDCDPDAWAALDPDAIQAETGAAQVALNGPRIGLLSSIVLSSGPRALERQRFGDLEMRFIATVVASPGQTQTPYEEGTVIRTSRFTYDAGTEVYELTAPDGSVYVMQSLSQIVDPELQVEDLADLGSRLALPEGWT